MNRATALITTTSLFLLIAITGSSLATNYYTSPVPNKYSGFGFSFLKPSFVNSYYNYSNRYSFFSGSFQLNAHVNLSPTVALNLVIPYSRVGYEKNYFMYDGNALPPNTKQGLGNIQAEYQMIHHQTSNEKSWLSFEIFIPTAKRKNRVALEVAELADVQHQQRYFPEVWTFGIQYINFAKFGPDNSAYHQHEFGGRVSMSSEGSGDTEFVIHYAFALGLDNSVISLGTELLGQFLVTGDDIDFTDRTMNQIIFGMSYVKKNFQPKLYYQMPLDDYHNNIIGSVLGLGFDLYLEPGTY